MTPRFRVFAAPAVLLGLLLGPTPASDPGPRLPPRNLLPDSDPPLFPQEPLLERFSLDGDSRESSELPPFLAEISGLATTPDGRLFGHDDERAVVYEIDPRTGSPVKGFTVGIRGLPGDFEGIAIVGPRFFLMTSRGEILEFEEGGPDSAMSYRVHRTGLGRVCELEGLAYDPREESLLLPCKEPRAPSLEDHLVILSVDVASMTVYPVPRVFLPMEDLEAVGLDDGFHPSAIEVHPETGALVLTSGRDEAILELSPGGRPLAARELRKRDHPQAEGIAFLPGGFLVLADEGQGSRGRLTLYRPLEPAPGPDGVTTGASDRSLLSGGRE